MCNALGNKGAHPMTDLADALLTAAISILAGLCWGIVLHLWGV